MVMRGTWKAGMIRRSKAPVAAVLSIAVVLAGSARPVAGPVTGVDTGPASSVTAEDLVTRWRKAVRAEDWDGSKTAVLTSLSTEDGIPGTVEEWVTATGDYRRVVDRKFDQTETVLTGHVAARRDWNGFVRTLRGKELERWRTAAFESAVIAFGPPQRIREAAVSQSPDHTAYLAHITPPGGAPMTWYVDAQTWLPVKSIRPGEDSEI